LSAFILSRYIPGLFREDVREKFGKEIEFLQYCAADISKEGIIIALKGMKEKKDQTARNFAGRVF